MPPALDLHVAPRDAELDAWIERWVALGGPGDLDEGVREVLDRWLDRGGEERERRLWGFVHTPGYPYGAISLLRRVTRLRLDTPEARMALTVAPGTVFEAIASNPRLGVATLGELQRHLHLRLESGGRWISDPAGVSTGERPLAKTLRRLRERGALDVGALVEHARGRLMGSDFWGFLGQNPDLLDDPAVAAVVVRYAGLPITISLLLGLVERGGGTSRAAVSALAEHHGPALAESIEGGGEWGAQVGRWPAARLAQLAAEGGPELRAALARRLHARPAPRR